MMGIIVELYPVIMIKAFIPLLLVLDGRGGQLCTVMMFICISFMLNSVDLIVLIKSIACYL